MQCPHSMQICGCRGFLPPLGATSADAGRMATGAPATGAPGWYIGQVYGRLLQDFFFKKNYNLHKRETSADGDAISHRHVTAGGRHDHTEKQRRGEWVTPVAKVVSGKLLFASCQAIEPF